MDKLNELKDHLIRIARLGQIGSVAWYDLDIKAPPKAVDGRAEALAELQSYVFSEFVSEKTGVLLDELSKPEVYEQLSDDDKALIRVTKKSYNKEKKVPDELQRKLSIAGSKSAAAWKEAKKNNDFNSFAPHLEEMVGLYRELAKCYGTSPNLYDTLLDTYEEGLTSERLMKINEELKKELVPFIAELSEKGQKPDDSFLKHTFDKSKQKELSMNLLNKFNYDFSMAILDEAAHPFSMKAGPGDYRITTRYAEDDFFNSLYSTIHEMGHSLYNMGINPDYENLPLEDELSSAVHESQSRFWENIIGRSEKFWNFFHPVLNESFPEFKDIKTEDLFRASNVVEKSFIRTEADEVTYNFHIMLRFEIEEALINGKIKVSELPELWNAKMKEYLGIVPPTDTLGVLQDVHWSEGLFGYFPSYMIGNLYSAQLFAKMRKDIPELDTAVEEGKFEIPLKWLREHVHIHGAKYSPEELIKVATGEEPNPKYFIDYIKTKYSKIYKLI